MICRPNNSAFVNLGTGKTTLLLAVINALKSKDLRVAKTATTGLAAALIDGISIHEFSTVGTRTLDKAQYGRQIITSDQREIIR